MVDNDNLYICNEHPMPVMYRGMSCPWCDFIKAMKDKTVAEYKRGFFDGATAANRDRDREAAATKQKEAENVAQKSKESENEGQIFEIGI
ncbi:MAG: hypothetical protein WC291_00145 [Thermodesulfovibrionales bacterium]|jgi:hypothetical protein